MGPRIDIWLREQLANGVPGLDWHDETNGIIKIAWEHGSTKEWTAENAGIFKLWAIYKDRHKDGDKEDYSKWKQTFRCAMKAAKYVENITDKVTGESKSDTHQLRYYKFKQEQMTEEFSMHTEKAIGQMSDMEKHLPVPVYNANTESESRTAENTHASEGRPTEITSESEHRTTEKTSESENRSTEITSESERRPTEITSESDHRSMVVTSSSGYSSEIQGSDSQPTQSLSPANTDQPIPKTHDKMTEPLLDEFLRSLWPIPDSNSSSLKSLPSDLKDFDIQPLDNNPLTSDIGPSIAFHPPHNAVINQTRLPQTGQIFPKLHPVAIPNFASQTQSTTQNPHAIVNTSSQSQSVSNCQQVTSGETGLDTSNLKQPNLSNDTGASMQLIRNPQAGNDPNLKMFTDSTPSVSVTHSNGTVETNKTYLSVLNPSQSTFNNDLQASNRNSSQNKRKNNSINVLRRLAIVNISELNCDCAYGMAIEIIYKGRTMGIWHTNNQVGCRLIPESDLHVNNEELDAVYTYGKGFEEMDTILFPHWPRDLGNEKAKECAEEYLEKASRGILLQCDQGSLTVTRLCIISVYSSEPVSVNNHRIERSKDQKRVTIFNFHDEFAPRLKCYTDKKILSPPNERVSLYLSQRASEQSILVEVKVSSCRALSSIKYHKKNTESLSMNMSEPDHYDLQLQKLQNMNINPENLPNKRMANNYHQ